MTEEQKYPWQEETNINDFHQFVLEYMNTAGIPSTLAKLYEEFLDFEWKRKIKKEAMENDDFHKLMLEHLGAIDITQYGKENIPQNKRIESIRSAMKGSMLMKWEKDSGKSGKIVPIAPLNSFMKKINKR